MSDGLEAGADLRSLAAWRRLNEFKSDIQGEKKSIEMEVMRVDNQVMRLKESRQWLSDMSIKVNQMAINTDFIEQNRLIKEFKSYLRKKIGLEKQEKEQEEGDKLKLVARGAASEASDSEQREAQRKTILAELNQGREALLNRERNWLANSLKPLTWI